MLADLFAALLEWVSENPHWAYFAVFLTAAGESLLVVGLILPGVALMFGFGALVAAGVLDLWATLAFAAAGAIAGDGVSFWIGRHFHQRLRVVWPFNRHAALINRGIDYFHHHGTKSVVLARFVGPLRPIVPAVAGMMDMAPRRFIAANVASALLWAPAYTLPGVVFGAALGLAAEVAGRLAVLLAVLVALIWFALWLVALVYRLLQPRAGMWLLRATDWGRSHPLLQPLVAAVLDPSHPEARGLAVLLVLLALASAVLGTLAGGWLVGIDLYVLSALQELRTPLADRILVAVTGLGDASLLLALLAAGCVFLAVRRRHHAALHWLAAGLSALALTHLLKRVVAAPRPLELVHGLAADSFPSGHTSLSLAVFGFLAVLIARELPLRRRWVPYLGATLLVIPIAFSRLYLGAHWFSDVLGGIAVGLACVALFGIAYRRHPERPVAWPQLAMVAGATVIALGLWRTGQYFDDELARHTVPRETESAVVDDWWTTAWQRQPAQRHDLRVRDRQALNVQYAGDPAELAALLAAQGWRVPPQFSAASALQWISPQPVAAAMPVLPQVHDGKHDALHLVRESDEAGALHILRLWPTRWRLQPGDAPLWIGSVSELELRQRLRMFSYLVTDVADAEPLAALEADLAGACEAVRHRRDTYAFEVVLVRGCDRAGGSTESAGQPIRSAAP